MIEKDILKQYRSLKREVATEQKRIDEMDEEIDSMMPEVQEVTDTVTFGKKGKKPLGKVTISGNRDHTYINRKRVRLRVRKAKQELHLAKLENMILDVEEYINNVEDSETRMMMRGYFLEGKNWTEVAKDMGEGYSGDACKKKVQRELGKI